MVAMGPAGAGAGLDTAGDAGAAAAEVDPYTADRKGFPAAAVGATAAVGGAL